MFRSCILQLILCKFHNRAVILELIWISLPLLYLLVDLHLHFKYNYYTAVLIVVVCIVLWKRINTTDSLVVEINTTQTNSII